MTIVLAEKVCGVGNDNEGGDNSGCSNCNNNDGREEGVEGRREGSGDVGGGSSGDTGGRREGSGDVGGGSSGDTGGRRGGSGGVRGDGDGSVIGEDGGNNSGSKRNKEGSVRRKGREGEEKTRALCK
ncbi:hypothetical protein H5410_061447 [Solanum commersonii]|uniref:Uncharacterized protein n=1 Tax=Solanum commersonii TaxID=4109 RepID=A0A9J5W832_SOLCO|nr:hypothetical protein H5410_061447 [Solanum commersonii]